MRTSRRGSGLIISESNDRKSWCPSVGSSSYSGTLEERLRQAENDVRRLSGMDALVDYDDESIITWNMRKQARQSTSTRGWIDIGLEDEANEATKPSQSPQLPPRLTLPPLPGPLFAPSPEPIELDATTTQHVCHSAPRSRQSSCASSRFHARPTNKIASSRSRGLRSDTCPDFTRPMSILKPVPGEDMERDPLHLRYPEEPPTPLSPPPKSPFAFESVKEARNHIEQQLKSAMESHRKPKPKVDEEDRPKKTRWSSLPASLMKFTKRHSKQQEALVVQDDIKPSKKGNKINLTTENLQRWEDEVGHMPKMYRMGGQNLVSSPVEVDMNVEESHRNSYLAPSYRSSQGHRNSYLAPNYPPSPKPQDQSFTPPASPSLAQIRFLQRHQQPYQQFEQQPSPSFARAIPSPLLTPPPDRRSLLSLASQKESAAESSNTLFTCIMCKEAEHPSTFPLRTITKACTHPTRTCLDCLRGWIDTCIQSGRWEGCTCPECGLSMSDEDVEAFSSAAGFMR